MTTQAQAKSPTIRFWNHVEARGKDECWEWTGKKDRTGYGRLWISDSPARTVQAHRLSWEIHNGQPAGDGLVCHSCDNPPCVNPDHLFLGTIQINMADKIAKGRQSRGEKAQHVLTEEVVRQLRARYAKRIRTRGVACNKDPNTVAALASEFGFNKWTVWDAVRGKRWAHIPME